MRSLEFFMPMRLPTKTHHDKNMTVVKGKPIMYDSAELKNVKQKLVAHLSQHAPDDMFKPPIQVTISYMYPADPKHPSLTWKTTKPDVDNMTKALLDAMRVCKFFKDDAQVAALQTCKYYWQHEGIVVSIMEMDASLRQGG